MKAALARAGSRPTPPGPGRAAARAAEHVVELVLAACGPATGGAPGEVLVVFGEPAAVAAATGVPPAPARTRAVQFVAVSLREGVRSALGGVSPDARGHALLAIAAAPAGAAPLLWADRDGFDGAFLVVGPP